MRRSIETGLKIQVLDRSLVPTYVFSKNDVIVTLGKDGLVANSAKYVGSRFSRSTRTLNVLMGFFYPFNRRMSGQTWIERSRVRRRCALFTLAEAKLKEGQRLLAFNDLFIGASSHVSARYRIRYGDTRENHSSSGIIVSTGAGSTGWLSSIFNETSRLSA